MRVARAVGKLARRGRARIRLAVLWCCQEQSTASKLRAAGAGSWKSGNWCLLCVMVIPIAPLARSKEKSIVSYGFA